MRKEEENKEGRRNGTDRIIIINEANLLIYGETTNRLR